MESNNVYLITGAAGFIGYHLSKRMLETDCTIIGYDNLNDYYDVQLKEQRLKELKKYEKFIFYKNDLLDYEMLSDIAKKYKISAVFHLAAQAGVRYSLINPRSYIESNIMGMFNILEVCKEHKINRLFYASSSSVYGNSNESQLKIDLNCDKPISLYGATKKTDELLAYVYSNTYNINTIGMRFFTVYGPYGRPDMAYYQFVDKILKGETIKIYNYGEQSRDFTYISDIVNAIMHLMEYQMKRDTPSQYQIYNIGRGKPVSLMDFINTIEKITGEKANKEYCKKQLGDVENTYADITQLINDTGYIPTVDIYEGLEKFYSWYRQQNGRRI